MRILLTTLLIVSMFFVKAQETEDTGLRYPIGAEFLIMNNDIKSAGMGNVRTIGAYDANSVFSNAARIAFQKKLLLSDVAITYNPLAQSVAKDIKLMSLATNFYVGGSEYDVSYLSAFIQFYTLGDVHFTDEQGNETDFLRPKEYALGVTYSKRFGEYFSMSLTGKGIYSQLGAERVIEGMKSASAFAIDFGVYSELPLQSDDFITLGLTANNIGTKLNYGGESRTNLPTGIKFGTGYKKNFDDESHFFIGADVTKSLVSYFEEKKSFEDGALAYNIGAEILFNDKIGFRGGYSMDNYVFNKVNHYTIGATLGTFIDRNKLAFDIAYQMPTGDKSLGLGSVFKLGISYSFFE